LNDLGMIYRDIGNEQQGSNDIKVNSYLLKSLDYLKQAVKMSELLPEQNKNRARYLNNLGEAYRMLGNLQEAEFSIQSALQLEKIEFPDLIHRLVASTYFNLGNVYLDKKEYQNAKIFFEKAIEISSDERVAGKNHPLLARHIDALGITWQNLGDNKKACEQFKSAYTILQSTGRGQKQLKELIENHINSCNLIN